MTDVTADRTVGYAGATPVRRRSRGGRQLRERVFATLCVVAASASVLTLVFLLVTIALQGAAHLDWDFITGVPSRSAAAAGLWPALVGTIMICAVCAVTAIPIGVATAILLEEYKPRHPWFQKAHGFVQLNITNLAGVPSIVYGILGLTVFVQVFGLLGTPNDPAVSFGISWYDRFITEGREVLIVPVEGKAASVTDPTAVDAFMNEAGDAVEVRLAERAALAPELLAMDDAVDAFGDGLDERIESIDATDAAAVGAAVDAAWQEAGLRADLEAVRSELVAATVAVQGLDGRERRRALRQAAELVEVAEARVRFPGVLLTDATPSRLSEARPWYVRLPFGRSVLAGGLTLMLVILPIVIIASQEALRAVPRSLRQASLALGATPWQTIQRTTLPAAVPGIMTGTILAMSRAIGEAAPILVIAGIVYITFTPEHLMDDFTAMPLQIFNWASRPQAEFHQLAAAGIILLLGILLVFNGLAIYIRQRTQK